MVRMWAELVVPDIEIPRGATYSMEEVFYAAIASPAKDGLKIISDCRNVLLKLVDDIPPSQERDCIEDLVRRIDGLQERMP